MDNSSLMSQGLTLLMLGMGTVFVFLAVLVVVTNLMSTLVQKYFPQPLVSPAAPTPAAPVPDRKLIAIITAAIHQHRSGKDQL